MRYIRQQPSLAHDHSLQAFCHLIERAAQLSNLVLPSAMHADRQIASSEEPNRGRYPADRRHHGNRGEPAQNARCTDHEKVIRKKRPKLGTARGAHRCEPILAVLGSLRRDRMTIGAYAPFGGWRRWQQRCPTVARHEIDTVCVEQIMMCARDAVHAGQIIRQRLGPLTVQCSARSLHLKFVQAVIDVIKMLPLQANRDLSKYEEGKRQGSLHRKTYAEIKRCRMYHRKPLRQTE